MNEFDLFCLKVNSIIYNISLEIYVVFNFHFIFNQLSIGEYFGKRLLNKSSDPASFYLFVDMDLREQSERCLHAFSHVFLFVSSSRLLL